MDKKSSPVPQLEIVHQVREKHGEHIEPQRCKPLGKCVLKADI
jgi:hypothetical protein